MQAYVFLENSQSSLLQHSYKIPSKKEESAFTANLLWILPFCYFIKNK